MKKRINHGEHWVHGDEKYEDKKTCLSCVPHAPSGSKKS